MKRKVNSTWRIVGTLGPGRCEHCGVRRDRRVTYDIRKGRKQLIVGSSCLSLFVKPTTPTAQVKPRHTAQDALQATRDANHMQIMIADPSTTLAHAMCRVWQDRKEYLPWPLDYTLRLLQSFRDLL